MKKKLVCSVCLLAAFILWTAAVCFVDVQVIGPQDSRVGLAGINRYVHNLTGVHWGLYTLTDWLGLVPVGVCAGFGIFGLAQWMHRKKLRKVDGDLLVLGAFYIVTIAAYLFFESFPINYRPVLIGGFLEVSYPSSTTLLVLCVMPTAMMQLSGRIQNRILKRWVMAAISVFIGFMVVGRLLSGVHWLTDIIGGILLSAGLVALYSSFVRCK